MRGFAAHPSTTACSKEVSVMKVLSSLNGEGPSPRLQGRSSPRQGLRDLQVQPAFQGAPALTQRTSIPAPGAGVPQMPGRLFVSAPVDSRDRRRIPGRLVRSRPRSDQRTSDPANPEPAPGARHDTLARPASPPPRFASRRSPHLPWPIPLVDRAQAKSQVAPAVAPPRHRSACFAPVQKLEPAAARSARRSTAGCTRISRCSERDRVIDAVLNQASATETGPCRRS